jgi:iron(III) transport system permease protein
MMLRTLPNTIYRTARAYGASAPVLPRPAFGLPQLPRAAGLYVIGALIAALAALPLIYLLLRASGAGVAGLEKLASPRALGILLNSALLAGAVACSAALIGVPFAWLTTRTTLPFRRAWLVLGLLPMVIPSYLGAMAFVEVFGPRGALQGLLEPLGVTRLPSLYGFAGAWLVITLCSYPYVVLPVRAALLKSDAALEEAARGMGLGRWGAFWRVTLPALRPALASGMLLTALYTLSDFGAVLILRYNAFTRAIYTSYQSFDREGAALLSLTLIACTFGLLAIERRAASQARGYRAGVGVRRAPAPIALKRWTPLALLFCAVPVMLGLLLPVIVLAGWALNPAVTSSVEVDFAALSANTLGVGLLTALVVALAALPLGVLATRHQGRFVRLMLGAAHIGNILPGLVIALALVFFAVNTDLYQTLPILILGYSLKFLPFSLGATRTALGQINPCLDEAARGLGLSPWQTTRRVTLPLARAGVLAGAALVFLNVLKELPTTLILSPIGFRTLAARAWTAYDSGSLGLIGAPGLLLVAASCLSLIVILWRDDRA